MKKKLLGLLLAATMACGMCVTAYAVEESEMEAVQYDESAFEGEWTSFNGGFDLYLPVDWEDVTDQVEAENVTFAMQAPDQSAAVAVAAVDTGLGEDATIEQIAEALSQTDGITVQDTYYNVNGIYCVGVTDANGNAGYAFLGSDGYCYTVCAGPVTADNQAVIAGILNSVSQTE